MNFKFEINWNNWQLDYFNYEDMEIGYMPYIQHVLCVGPFVFSWVTEVF